VKPLEPAPGPLVAVGRIGAPHGLRGEFRLLLETDFPERLQCGRPVVLQPREGAQSLPTEVAGVRPAPGRRDGVLLTVAALASREAVRPFVGGWVCVPQRSLPALPAGQYYHHQLVGLEVTDAAGGVVGHVAAIARSPAHDLFVVQRPDGRTVLVPAAKVAVAAIDLGARRLQLRPLPGLGE